MSAAFDTQAFIRNPKHGYVVIGDNAEITDAIEGLDCEWGSRCKSRAWLDDEITEIAKLLEVAGYKVSPENRKAI